MIKIDKKEGMITLDNTEVGSAKLHVNVSIMDKLMNLAGELVLTRNQLIQAIELDDKKMLGTAGQKVDLITSELQETIMATRMQPVGVIFQSFRDMIRDMATKEKKDIKLSIQGEDVELDTTLIEAIGEPVKRILQHEIEHTIELPEVREKSKKSKEASIQLKAYHEAGKVVLEIINDGAGIDYKKVSEHALKTGIKTKEQLKLMSKDDIIKLIFLPAFSEIETDKDLSKLGGGLDTVLSNIIKSGGTLDISTEVGVGTRFYIKLPLSLAIIPSIILKVENERFAIPQVNLVELVRISPDKVKERIERIHDTTVMRLRGELLPILRLSDIFGIDRHFDEPESESHLRDGRDNIHDRRIKSTPDISPEKRQSQDRRSRESKAINVIVVNSGDLTYGLIVDELMDSEEIVVKPLGQHLNTAKGYAGATILGDGHSALILDIAGISILENLKPVVDDTKIEGLSDTLKDKNKSESLLIVKNSSTEHFAIPLASVIRIEKIHRKKIENSAGKLSMQYAGGNIKLFTIESVANVQAREDVEFPLVIMFQAEDMEVGLLVSEIVDAKENDNEIDNKTFKQAGILGSVIIMGKTTMILDIQEIANADK